MNAMHQTLTDCRLSRAGWGDNSVDLDVARIEPAGDLDVLPNLLRITMPPGGLAGLLSWTDRSGCALQCQLAFEPAGRPGYVTLKAAEAVRRTATATVSEIELVDGWQGEPFYWGNRDVQEEEVEAAIHGLATDDDLQLLSDPTQRDVDGVPRGVILRSEADQAVLFTAHSPAESTVLSGVVRRLHETGTLVQTDAEQPPPAGSWLARTPYRRSDKAAPRVTRWLGGHGTRAQQAFERRTGVPWPVVQRWQGARP